MDGCRHEAVREWLMWECRYHNHDLYFSDFGRAFKSIDIDSQFLPDSEQSWRLPYVIVPKSKVGELFLEPEPLSARARSIIYTDESQSHYRFFVHPYLSQIVRDRLFPYMIYVEPSDSEFMAQPTSSLRSLVVWRHVGEVFPIMVKVSVFATAHNQVRFVDWNAACYHFSRRCWLKQIQATTLEPLNLGLLDETGFFGLPLIEPFGVNPQELAEGQQPSLHCLANIVREFPPEVLEGKKKLLSCTAYTSPIRKPVSFIEEFSKRSSKSILESIDAFLFEPAMHALEGIADRHGLTLEPHAQNLLIEIDITGMPSGRLIFRDFGAVWLDPLRAFLKSPDLLVTLMNCNGWKAMDPTEAAYSRLNVFRSIGTNFVHSTAFRALAAMVLQEKISNEDAEHCAAKWRARVTAFMQAYFGQVPRFDPLQVERSSPVLVREQLEPKINQVSGISSLSDLQSQQLSEDLLSLQAGSKKVAPVCWFSQSQDLQDAKWHKHHNGYVVTQGDRIACLLMERQ